MMHLYNALLCIVVHPKRFTIMWGGGGGVTLQPPPVCSIHLDDATDATGQRCQCAQERVIEPIKWIMFLRTHCAHLFNKKKFYTIIQSITSSEMCSLHLTHPSAHTWSSGQLTLRHPGSSRGDSVPCSRVSPQSWRNPAGAEIRTHNLGLQVQRSIH